MITPHPWLVPAGLVVVAATLVGCGEATVEDPSAASGGSAIDGDYLSNGAPNPPFRDGSEPIRLTLRDGEISFTASCNHFSGQATWDDGVLRTSALGGTEMGCPGDRQTQDEWMIDFFGSTPTLELDGTDLAVRSEKQKVWFVPEGEVASGEPGDPGDLVETEWRLTGIGERDGDSVGMMVVPGNVRATIRFHDGKTSFRSGCNSGGGRATVAGDTITFGRLGTTVMGCLGAAGEVERGVTRVLQGKSTVSWSITGDELRLRTRDGRHELVYHR
jgi:heat shock protein HslJ